jgi:hypothetical protein
MAADLTPIYREAHTWAAEHSRHPDTVVHIRFASWLCGYTGGISGPDLEQCWEEFNDTFGGDAVNALAAAQLCGPVHGRAFERAFEWAYCEADNDAAERFAAWYLGYYHNQIVNGQDPSITWQDAWGRFLELFSDVAAKWGVAS